MTSHKICELHQQKMPIQYMLMNHTDLQAANMEPQKMSAIIIESFLMTQN